MAESSVSASGNSTVDFTKFYNIIGGTNRTSPDSYHGINPATETKLWDAPVATIQDVEDAVTAAQKGFPDWASRSYRERTKLLEQFADLYLKHADQLIELLKEETGRSTQNAAIEVYWAANWLRYPSRYEIPEKRVRDEEKIVVTKYEPLGVVAAICPWNFPLMLAIGKIAPAVATGNMVIVKPSPFSPYTALKLAELAQQIFPPSVIQVLGGNDELGPLLVNHPGIQKISFTGSTSTGKKVMEACAATMKRVTLETAGNNASIILPDIDIDKIAPQVAAGLWFNAGQVCLSSRRLYIHEKIYRIFLDRLTAVTNNMATDLAEKVGPIQNELQYEKIKVLLKDSLDNGYRFLTEEMGPQGGPGFFIRPAIIDNPPVDARIIQEEQFGPVIPCIPFSSLDEAILLANATEGGLAASVWTSNREMAEEVASKLDAGNIYINGPPKPDPFVPFSGHKQSGIGVEYGLEGLLGYCQIKAMYFYQ